MQNKSVKRRKEKREEKLKARKKNNGKEEQNVRTNITTGKGIIEKIEKNGDGSEDRGREKYE